MPVKAPAHHRKIEWAEITSDLLNEENNRFDAAFFHIDGIRIRQLLQNSGFQLKKLTGENSVAVASHRPRFKRIFVKKSELPIYQPGQITENDPEPAQYISAATDTKIEDLRVKKGQILLTCSGTIGTCTIVNEKFDGSIFSHDLLRIDVKDKNVLGYVYAFLKSSIGQKLLTTNSYGAVVDHIEPEHLDSILIPMIGEKKILEIQNKILEAFSLRDRAFKLIRNAKSDFYELLKIPRLEENISDFNSEIRSWEIADFGFERRLDASFYLPIADRAIKILLSAKHLVVPLSDTKYVNKVFIPGRFKRIYVDIEHGVPFLSGRNISQISPQDVKYIAPSHTKNLKSYLLNKGWVLVTCSGTIGKTTLTTKAWEGWAASQHVLRVVPEDIHPGFLFAFISSDYGNYQILKYTHGSVVDEISAEQIKKVQIAIPSREIQSKIGDNIVEAFDLRAKANDIEKLAIELFEKEINES